MLISVKLTTNLFLVVNKCISSLFSLAKSKTEPSHAMDRWYNWSAGEQMIRMNDDKIRLIGYMTDAISVKCTNNIDHITGTYGCVIPCKHINKQWANYWLQQLVNIKIIKTKKHLTDLTETTTISHKSQKWYTI